MRPEPSASLIVAAESEGFATKNLLIGIDVPGVAPPPQLVPELFVSLHEVPGAFEIPLLVREMASHENVDAVIALGVIIRGETSHAEFIARAVTESLQRISLDFAKPVIHEVLLVENVAQARRRCLEPEINRGTESARAAVAVLETLREARRK